VEKPVTVYNIYLNFKYVALFRNSNVIFIATPTHKSRLKDPQINKLSSKQEHTVETYSQIVLID